MPSIGKSFGSAKPGAATLATLFTIGEGKETTFSLFAANQGAGTSKVRIAIADAATPGAAEYVIYGDPLPATGNAGANVSYGPFAAQSGKKVVVYSDTGDVSFQACGFEDSLL